jgi:hypothetical protein
VADRDQADGVCVVHGGATRCLQTGSVRKAWNMTADNALGSR